MLLLVRVFLFEIVMKIQFLKWTEKKDGGFVANGKSNVYTYSKNMKTKKFVLIIGSLLNSYHVAHVLKTETACRTICHNLEFN